jgi:hypothetical protein
MLTAPQLATLKAAILADPVLSAFPNNDDGHFGVAAELNKDASPVFFVWRTSITSLEIMQNGFDWARVDNLTVGKARIWDWMMRTGTLNPSLANVRAGVLAVFGVAADLATRQAVFNHFQRPASRFEQLYASGSGATSTDQGIGPATLGLEGPIGYQDVSSARNS